MHNNFLRHQLLHVLQELSTPGGGGPLAQTIPTLNWSTLEELEEPTSMFEGDQQKEFAYLITLTISQTQLTSLLQYTKLPQVLFRELNMKLTLMFLETHCNTYMNKMHRALSVMFQPNLQPSWSQLKLCVHHPGPGSTMDT